MLSALQNSQGAIIAWAGDMGKASKRAADVVEPFMSLQHWWQLGELLTILKPIHIAQKQSEAQNSTMMEVTERWSSIGDSIRSRSQSGTFQDELRSYLEDGWVKRMNRQVHNIHWLAFYLDPSRCSEPMWEPIRGDVEKLLRDPQNPQLWREFVAFRQKSGPFFNAGCWQEKNPSFFWLEAVS